MEKVEGLISFLTEEVKQLKESMQFMNIQFEDCMKELKEARNELKETRKEREKLNSVVIEMQKKIRTL